MIFSPVRIYTHLLVELIAVYVIHCWGNHILLQVTQEIGVMLDRLLAIRFHLAQNFLDFLHRP